MVVSREIELALRWAPLVRQVDARSSRVGAATPEL